MCSQLFIGAGGGGVQYFVGRVLLCNATDILKQDTDKICTLFFRKIGGSAFTQCLGDSALLQLWILQPIQLWIDSFESECSYIWLMTHQYCTTLAMWPPILAVRYVVTYIITLVPISEIFQLAGPLDLVQTVQFSQCSGFLHKRMRQ